MTTTSTYHHGDLPGALVTAAVELLDEEGGAGDLSLRAVARRAGVSTAAPYRHFPDRNALISAVAAVGYRELAATLAEASPAPSSPDDLADIGVAYVNFALHRTGLFRAMFAEPCGTDPDRVEAVDAITAYLHHIVAQALPSEDVDATATAVWALVHGLAFLHLDGKLDSSSPAEVDRRVRSTVRAALVPRG
ncbi:Transcriptional regulator, TetR family OS=Tsukamurella paurometabola (strain ATCC 8368 / DSM/ CCUG 35730 / CIP 100753 / JCM 10117 / KCTC 9821 / NBRC 16120/ NCIMB 702349 / NCTC 13040) OX=521096 GN=Tpau_2518 PE=4 SV=1 [Tsukamurella paurometabola]|uniref:Transcriptional regulator, TetR family n=1 Tax=Tsukamurella paurometabola (strain ATCC 8368 / DSM 20162 / CCUG 35730 / CIP 100753 / JCM 10117 / KCTC 9821 / NBRC 16120 / NCIMB 702349 / NCTC 13040) TaxID=521096 RepID=D5URR7_TSUPD|nr:TetR/AcrR family transcriptional regulator [Tsukamurella paurometabola]ADG79122.1 transcriptional regulator, TetR family [Tsukamurella paurometabola DSM 20162]SUP34162.1 DNA-binding transcriptional repressor FabR [Tsukamurella paurometabola]